MNFKYKYDTYDDQSLISFEKIKITFNEGETSSEG